MTVKADILLFVVTNLEGLALASVCGFPLPSASLFTAAKKPRQLGSLTQADYGGDCDVLSKPLPQVRMHSGVSPELDRSPWLSPVPGWSSLTPGAAHDCSCQAQGLMRRPRVAAQDREPVGFVG